MCTAFPLSKLSEYKISNNIYYKFFVTDLFFKFSILFVKIVKKNENMLTFYKDKVGNEKKFIPKYYEIYLVFFK